MLGAKDGCNGGSLELNGKKQENLDYHGRA
jgi:hypothetical protein